MLKFVLVSTAIDLEFIPYHVKRLLKNWTLRLPWVFLFIGSEVYNIVDKTFPLPLLLKEGYVWFRGRSLLLHGITGSQLRPILDRSGGSAVAGRLTLLLVYDCF